MSYAQWRNNRKRRKVTQEQRSNYYIAAGTAVRIYEESDPDGDMKNHITRQDLTFITADEVSAPPGWRAFTKSGYVLQAEEQDVLYSALWTIF